MAHECAGLTGGPGSSSFIHPCMLLLYYSAPSFCSLLPVTPITSSHSNMPLLLGRSWIVDCASLAVDMTVARTNWKNGPPTRSNG